MRVVFGLAMIEAESISGEFDTGILLPDSGIRKGEFLADVLDVSPEGIGDRIRQIRGQRFADPFLDQLLAHTGHKISRTALSRMENGKEAVTLADIVAIAAVDPKNRGREWLAFGVYEARKSRRAGIPREFEITPGSTGPQLRVAEQGRNGPATDEPSELPKRPIRRRPKP